MLGGVVGEKKFFHLRTNSCEIEDIFRCEFKFFFFILEQKLLPRGRKAVKEKKQFV